MRVASRRLLSQSLASHAAVFTIVFLSSSLPTGAQAPTDSDPGVPAIEVDGRLDRALLIEAVLARNPAIAAATAAWEAARQRPNQVRSLDDPTLSYSFSPRSAVADGVRYGQVLRLSQRVPYPGTRRLRGEVADALAAADEQVVEIRLLSLARLASLLFDDFYVLERAEEINEEHIGLLSSFQRIAVARYAAGEAPQQAPLQAEVEAAHLLHQRVRLATERTVLTSRINSLLHRPPDEPLPSPPQRLRRYTELTKAPLQELLEEAMSTRPELEALRLELVARGAEVALAALAFRPDFELMGSFNSMWARSEHRTMVGVGVNVPIRRRRLNAARAEAQSLAFSAESELEVLADRIRQQVATTHAGLLEAHHIVELYESRLLPATRDQVEAALAGFRTGQSSFLALIDAERSQRTVRLEYEKALADTSRRQTELEQALGRLPTDGGQDEDVNS